MAQKKDTAKKEAKKCRVEYGPFRKLKAREAEKKGDCTVIEKDGQYILRTNEMSEKDAKLMVETLISAGYNAKVL